MLDLKQRRLELGLTMAEVAERVGVSEATISRYESGDIKNMRRERIGKYARALQVAPSEFIDDIIVTSESQAPYDDKPTFPPKREGLNAAKVVIKKLAPDEVRDEAKQKKAINEMSTEELLSLLDDVTKALQDKQRNSTD